MDKFLYMWLWCAFCNALFVWILSPVCVSPCPFWWAENGPAGWRNPHNTLHSNTLHSLSMIESHQKSETQFERAYHPTASPSLSPRAMSIHAPHVAAQASSMPHLPRFGLQSRLLTRSQPHTPSLCLYSQWPTPFEPHGGTFPPFHTCREGTQLLYPIDLSMLWALIHKLQKKRRRWSSDGEWKQRQFDSIEGVTATLSISATWDSLW